MAIKQEFHSIKGIQRDLTVSKFSPEYAFDANNIRLTARDGNNLLSVTNEKGTKELILKSTSGEVTSVEGTLIGYNVLNEYLTLFTTGDTDRIYRLEDKGSYFELILLFSGDLSFNIKSPIETLGVYENKNIQKVYWIDGKNQSRVINIATDDSIRESWVKSSFDFIPELKLNEHITISPNTSVTGFFPSGIVQYAFTYYNRYGSESNIIYTTPLYYCHANNRGGSPEESSSNSFNIVISNPDINFEYIRIYSIVRTSINALPTVKQVADLRVNKADTIRYTDSNKTGAIIDSSLLLYIGGRDIIAGTIAQKDNTLFLGNLHINTKLFSNTARTLVKGNVSFDYKTLDTKETVKSVYDYKSQLGYNSYQITSFKGGETYRFGVQFQNIKGEWSEVLYIGDEKVSMYPSIINNNTVKLNLIKPTYTIPASVIEEAKSLGYIKARGMVVLSSNKDRSILCQGVVAPTLWNNLERESNIPYAQSSWFFRPFVAPERTGGDEDKRDANYGTFAYYVDYDNIESPHPDRNTEIGTTLFRYIDEESTEYRGYLIDSNILTFHSPEIEFGDVNTNNLNLNCKFIGSVALDSGVAYRSVTAKTVGVYPDIDYGIYKKFPQYINQRTVTSSSGGRLLVSGFHWMGIPLATKDSNKLYQINWGWLVSPWQRQGSLINDFRYGEQTLSELKNNKLSNLRVSYFTDFTLSGNDFWSPPNGISNVEIVDSNEINITPIKKDDTSITYYGNIDKIIPPGNSSVGGGYTIGVSENNYLNPYPIEKLYEATPNSTGFINQINLSAGLNIPLEDNERYSKSPVSIKYKSGKHAVFALKDVEGKRVILPNSNGYTEQDGKKVPNVRHTIDNTAIFEYFDVNYSGLWLVELTQEVSEDSRFGGNTEEALLNNIWIIAGDPIDIRTSSTISYLQGDTYLQRYDCLKTYPYTLDDLNSVTEVISFYCETHINIDGRYDKNRGNISNLSITPSIFNLYNAVYSQENNYFTYHYLNDSYSLDDFPNTITWTKEKILGDEIDNWTKINLATTLDLDGDKGEVVSLNTFNNEIYCFQRRGLSNILFNSRVQIPTSDGVPIEITNGLKVSGKRYVSNSIGCTNKWSIVESPSGLYFIDNETNSLYLFNGQIQSLSDKLGFRQWVSDNNSHENWDPVNYNNFRSFYDKNNNDIYFIDKDECLCYSELLGQFTSFMSYEKVPAMFNIGSEFYSFNKGKLWQNFEGDYNMFYGDFKPYSITIVANSDEPYDKIFNNIEFRSDSWDGNTLINTKTFDTLDVWNEYQHGTSTLTNIIGKPSPLKKKFRVWRANVPRDNSNKRDRIRNTWAYVKLSMNTPNTWKTEFHDMTVHYFI